MRATTVAGIVALALLGLAISDTIGAPQCFADGDLMITPFGVPRPGETVTFELLSPSSAGKQYQVISSLGSGPIRVGSHLIPLSYDPCFFASMSGQFPNTFVNYKGVLDVFGLALPQLAIPNHHNLIGVDVHTLFITGDAQTKVTGVPGMVSHPVTLTIQP